MYNPEWVKEYYDLVGEAEYDRLQKTAEDFMKFEIHRHYLRRNIKNGDYVLEIGAGPGVFTSVLHELGARIAVADISPAQIEANKKNAGKYGFDSSVDSWNIVDICDLSIFADRTFDAVVAYGGPLSYVFDKIDAALRECNRVLKPSGLLISSVMSLWGTINSGVSGVLNFPFDVNQKIIDTGELTAENLPGHKHFCQMYTSKKLSEKLTANDFINTRLSSSNFLSIRMKTELDEIHNDVKKWDDLVKLEIQASAADGCVDSGTHIISVSQKL